MANGAQADPVRSVLDPLDAPKPVKAAAWQAFHSSETPEQFRAYFDSSPLPRQAKAALWNAKFGQSNAASQTDTFGAAPAKPGALQRFSTSAAESMGLPPPQGGFWQTLKQYNPVPGLEYMGQHPIDAAKLLGGSLLQSHEQAAQQGLERAKQPGVLPKVVGLTEYLESGIPFLGPSLVKAGRQFESGNVAGGAGSMVGPVAAVAGMPEARATLGDVAGAVRGAPKASKSAPVQALVPEAAGLPGKAISGAERVFRAAAPTAADQGFRANLYTATPDLAQIARETPLQTKGGIIRPDLRVREFVNNVDNHLAKMYTEERAPQIARNGQAVTPVSLSTDAADAARWLGKTLGKEGDRSIAGALAEDRHLSLADADALARSVNRELLRYERMNPSEQAGARITNRRIAGLKDLDRALSESINGELDRRGEPGIQDYERRYAALRNVRDTVAKRMNAVEQQRFVDRMREFATVRNVGFSAGRAAIGGTGRTLAKGMRQLGETELAPTRGLTLPPPIRGLLPARGTTSPLITPPYGYSTQTPGEILERGPGLVEAERSFARGPGGKFRRIYTSRGRQ